MLDMTFSKQLHKFIWAYMKWNLIFNLHKNSKILNYNCIFISVVRNDNIPFNQCCFYYENVSRGVGIIKESWKQVNSSSDYQLSISSMSWNVYFVWVNIVINYTRRRKMTREIKNWRMICQIKCVIVEILRYTFGRDISFFLTT